jgi:hypothetical protein
MIRAILISPPANKYVVLIDLMQQLIDLDLCMQQLAS